VSTVVVYVHGLWQRGAESLWLRRRLAQELKAEARAFSYPSVTADAGDIARNLANTLTAIHADTLHLVGHSLGGLVILRACEVRPSPSLTAAPQRFHRSRMRPSPARWRGLRENCKPSIAWRS